MVEFSSTGAGYIMKVAPNLGIGDLLILRMKTWDMPVNTLVIQTSIVRTYRTHPDTYISFLQAWLPRLFPGVQLEYDTEEPTAELDGVRIQRVSVYEHYVFQVPPTILLPTPYVVLHTRARFDTHPPNFEHEVLPRWASTLRSLRSVYPIVLLGEREIERNVQSIEWGIQSLYSVVRDIPGVIDMTRDNAGSSNTIEQFECDMHVIHGAKFNVVFGYGGPLTLSLAFGRRTLGYIGGIQHPVVDDYSKWAFFHRDMRQFLDVLQTKLM